MNYENILLEKKNSIAYVTINRPKVLNALNMATMEELRAAFHDIKNDASTRMVIFTGAGEKAFIAGADIGELACSMTGLRALEINPLWVCGDQIEALDVLVVANEGTEPDR